MTFSQLLDGAEVLSRSGDADVRGIEYDSRQVHPGDVFVAIKGEKTDGNHHIDAAIKAGAAAVITDSPAEAPRPGVAWVVTPHGRRALARVSANFYRRPAEKLAMSGITGTNGKTTAAFLLESILTAAGRNTLMAGTIECHVAGRVLPAPHTTPEALELERMFSEGVRAGATEAVMEVSSHALAQERVFGLPFQVAVFTNLTRDHLDYHGSFEEYFAAKRVLFSGCGAGPPPFAVVNLDDEYGRELAQFSKGKSEVLGYGLEKGDFHAEKIVLGQSGTRFDLAGPEAKWPIWSPLAGRFNVYNILAAAAAAYARNCSGPQIVQGVAALSRVPGRFEKIDMGQPFTLVVDYAHTDDALRNLTALAREFVSRNKGRVITLFGCGGNRDRSKRPLMGEAAGKGSDFVVLTSDNPRNEDPLAIMNDALPGLQRTGVRYSLEPDRGKAIVLALNEARPGDIVLLAGKGHEQQQIGREGAVPFNDAAVAREVLAQLGYGLNPAVAEPGKEADL
jgi:UDP-N-acetylmuramoyl-L-alanyl-D-glutamate--2,6-diaminopimelate ligase